MPRRLVEIVDAPLGPVLFRRVRRSILALGTEGIRRTYQTTFWFPLDGDPAHRQMVGEHLKKVISAAKLLGLGVVNTFIGRDPARTVQAQWDLLRFTVLGRPYDQESHRAFLAATATGLVASANPAAGPVAAPGLLGYRLCVDGAWFPQDPSRPPL